MRARKNRGMTLIEVLVAFVILSLAMGVIMQIFFGGMRNARLADGYSRAVFLAQSKLAAVGVERPLMAGDANGQLGVDMRWRITVNPYDDGGAADRLLMAQRLYQVQVVVSWSDEGRQRQIALDSLRMGPKP